MNRLPNWLRWLLFLPLSIIASIFVYPIIKIINSLFDSIPQLQLFLFVIGAGLTGYIFVIVAVKVVPKHKVMVSIIMASTYMILAGITLYEKLTFGKIIQMNMFETISLAVVGTLVAVITCYQTYDDLISSSSELEKLNDAYADKSLMQKLKEESDISAPNSDDLENDVLQIMSILDSEIGEFEEKQLAEADLLSSSTESDDLIDVYQNESLTQELKEDKDILELISKDLEQQVLQTTTELNFILRKSKTNQLTKYVEDFYKSIGEDDKVALINTEIFHLWCMIVTIFDFSIDSNFRRKLIKFFNTKVNNLYLKWKEFTKLDATEKPYIDFNNFSYYSNQIRLNNLHLNSSYQNTKDEIVFGKIVLTKIHESMGDRKIDVDRKTILMPVQIYYEIKQRVIEILNNSTNTICC